MKKKSTFILSLISILSLSLSQMHPVLACAFSSQTYFTYTNHPDLPLNSFAAGKLGILHPGYARSYLFCAYRYLSGANLNQQEQNELVNLWNSRLTSDEFGYATDTSAWLKARQQVPGAPKIERLFTDRPVSKEEGWQTYCNCQPDGFGTAIKRLQDLIAKHGADSALVKEWLAGQDKVFSNCGGEPYSDKVPAANIPQALPSSGDPALQKDRAYQIASANFYAQNFEIARKEFESIAADAASPWKQISAYLAVRSMIRQASLSKELNTKLLAQASEKLKQLMSDSSFAALQSDLESLRSFINARLAPAEHLKELAATKLTQASLSEITKTIDNLIGDDGTGMEPPKYSDLPKSLKEIDSIDWVMTFQSRDESAKQHALERWKATKALPWFLAVADKSKAKDANAAEIISECGRIKDGPARWTVFYHANRLNMENGKNAEVKNGLDAVLSKAPADLPLGTLNMLKTQRLVLASSLDEFVRFAFQNPESPCCNGGCEQVPDDISEIIKTGKVKLEPAVFTAEAGNVMDNKLPLSVLKQLALNNKLPTATRSNIAWTSWVRAVLIGDEKSAQELALLMKPLNKQKEKLVDAYLAAATPETRKFAAVFLMLQYSSAQPNPSWGPLQEDDYGDASGWWWSAAPIAAMEEGSIDINPLFLTAAQKTQAKQELTKHSAAENSTDFMGKTVLAFAKANAADARVPQALHLVVKATRYGTQNQTLSKQAFQLLHSRYKGNAWTKKTPYFY